MAGNGFNIKIGTKLDTKDAEKAIGQLTKRIDTLVKTSTGEVLTRTVQTFTKEVKNADGTVKKYVQTVKGLLNAENKWVDANGKVLKDQGAMVVKQEQTTKAVKTSTNAINQNSQALKGQANAVGVSNSAFSKFVDTMAKTAYFQATNKAIQLFSQSCREAVDVIMDYNAAMTELKKVTDFTDEEYSKLATDLDEIAGKVARTRTELTESVTEFAKSGSYTTEELQNLAYAATLYQNVADSELSAADAASYIISQMKAYGIAAQDAMTIIDKTNEVSNNFAVSSTDISQALTKGAAALASYGNSIDETIGLVTAGTEVMTGQASKVVKGMRTIGANIINTAEGTGKLEISVNGVTKSIDLLDSKTGDLRSTYEVLKDVAESWDDMTNSEQSALALQLAGKTQIDVFTSVLGNFKSAVDAVNTSLDAAGSAESENAKYLESLEAKVAAVKQEFTTFVLGEGGLESFAKGLLNAVGAVLKFVNAIGGMKTVMTTLITVGIMATIANIEKLGKALRSTITSIISFANRYTEALITLDDATIGLATAEEAAAASTLLLKTAIMGAVAAVGLIVIAVQNYKRAQEEAKQAALDTLNAFEQERQAIDENIKHVADEATSREELIAIIKEKLGDAYDEEKENLKDVNELRQEAIDLLDEEARRKAQDTINSTGTQYTKSKKYLESKDKYSVGTRYSGTYFEASGTPEEVYEAIGKKLEEYNKKIQDGIVLQNAEENTLKRLEKAYADYGEEINNAKEIVEKYEAAQNIVNETAEESDRVLDGYTSHIEEAKNTMESVSEIFKEFGYDTFKDFKDAVEDAGGSMDDFYDALAEGSDKAKEYLENTLGMKETSEQLQEVLEEEMETYETLQAIIEKYNETGQLTEGMLEQLASISPQYIANLSMENEAIGLNVDLMTQQFEVQKQLALINVQTAEQLAIVAVCEQTLGEETSKTTTQLYQDEQQANALETAYGSLTSAANKAADAMARVRSQGLDTDEFYKAIEDARKPFDELEKAIENTEITTHKATQTATKGARTTAKANEKAAEDSEKAWEEAYEKEKAVLEHMHEMGEISDEEFYRRLLELNEQYFGEASGHHEKYLQKYLKNEEEVYKGLANAYKKKVEKQKKEALKAIDAEIKGVKKAKDAALKAIDERIKAIKKQKEEAIKAIEAEIKALNKQKEAQHKYFQDKIDALQRAHDLQEQINKLEEYENQLAQAKAQRVWVMKDGQFQLSEDESAVNNAEQQLSDYKDDLDYERQIQELQDLQNYWDEYYEHLIEQKEEYKEYLEEYYDNQIEAMEEYRDRVEEEYDAQIEALEEYRDQVEEMYDNMLENYEEHVKQMLEKFDEFNKGNEEKYGKALEDLRAFVAEWNALIGSMSAIDGSFASGGITSGLISLKHHSSGAAEIGSYASGNNSSVRDDEIALVGESPNTEMLIGSKVNTGVVARLHKGSGVVNAQSTKTLAGILNSLGKNSYVGGSGTNGVTQNFSFGAINLPNVTDANSFVETLKNTFSSYSIQFATGKA